LTRGTILRKPLHYCGQIVFLVWIGIAGAVNAQESYCDPGVYIGKIGNVPVTMALDPTPDKSSGESRVGSMYYRVSMVDMVLKQEPGPSVWIEFDGDNKPSGRITLACQDKQLTGEWNSLDGKKRFPVVASRSPSDSYNARRFSALKPIKTPKESQSRSEAFPVTGPKIQGYAEPAIHGIQLFGTEPGLAKVNRLLWMDLLSNTESLLSCSLEFRQRFGENQGDLGFEQRLSHTAGPYVVVSSAIGFECGRGLRFGVEMATYRLTDGRKIDSSQWFKPELSTLWGQEWRATPLAKLVLKAGRSQMHKDDAECFEAADYWLSDVYPSPEGFVFRGSLPTPFQRCQGTVDVTLPYAALAPYLSAEGKRAVQAIQKMPNP
jgi:hypothetical protein